jgi:hypothetical protein
LSTHELDIESILVCTGVYNPSSKPNQKLEIIEVEHFTHLKIDVEGKQPRNLPEKYQNKDPILTKPSVILNDILDAVLYVVEKQNKAK